MSLCGERVVFADVDTNRKNLARTCRAYAGKPGGRAGQMRSGLAQWLCGASDSGRVRLMNGRAVVEALSKALVTVAVMLSILLFVKGPATEDPARTFTAFLLALGTIGLVA